MLYINKKLNLSIEFCSALLYVDQSGGLLNKHEYHMKVFGYWDKFIFKHT